jgi:hypothetical protein
MVLDVIEPGGFSTAALFSVSGGLFSALDHPSTNEIAKSEPLCDRARHKKTPKYSSESSIYGIG